MCVPGMPCYQSQIYFTPKCGANPFKGYPINSNLLCYSGPILSNTGINPGDSITLALQKIDNQSTATNVAEQFFAAIMNNPSLKNIFATLVNSVIT
jgi:hypothetical protein